MERSGLPHGVPDFLQERHVELLRRERRLRRGARRGRHVDRDFARAGPLLRHREQPRLPPAGGRGGDPLGSAGLRPALHVRRQRVCGQPLPARSGSRRVRRGGHPLRHLGAEPLPHGRDAQGRRRLLAGHADRSDGDGLPRRRLRRDGRSGLDRRRDGGRRRGRDVRAVLDRRRGPRGHALPALPRGGRKRPRALERNGVSRGRRGSRIHAAHRRVRGRRRGDARLGHARRHGGGRRHRRRRRRGRPLRAIFARSGCRGVRRAPSVPRGRLGRHRLGDARGPAARAHLPRALRCRERRRRRERHGRLRRLLLHDRRGRLRPPDRVRRQRLGNRHADGELHHDARASLRQPPARPHADRRGRPRNRRLRHDFAPHRRLLRRKQGLLLRSRAGHRDHVRARRRLRPHGVQVLRLLERLARLPLRRVAAVARRKRRQRIFPARDPRRRI